MKLQHNNTTLKIDAAPAPAPDTATNKKFKITAPAPQNNFASTGSATLDYCVSVRKDVRWKCPFETFRMKNFSVWSRPVFPVAEADSSWPKWGPEPRTSWAVQKSGGCKVYLYDLACKGVHLFGVCPCLQKCPPVLCVPLSPKVSTCTVCAPVPFVRYYRDS